MYYIAGFFCAVLVAECAVYVTSRLINHPIVMMDEMQRFTMIWMAFIANPVLISRKGHLLVDLVPIIIPEKARRTVYLVGELLVLVFNIYMIIPGFNIMKGNLIAKSTAMQINMGLVYSIIPISFFLATLAQINNLLGQYEESKKKAA